MKKILNFFDKFEDVCRVYLSKHPIPYSIIGGFTIILLWRSIWHTADMLQAEGGFWGWFFYPPNQIIIDTLILMAIGLIVATFIGDQVLISGMKKDKKISEKVETEVGKEEVTLIHLRDEIRKIQKQIEEMNGKAIK